MYSNSLFELDYSKITTSGGHMTFIFHIRLIVVGMKYSGLSHATTDIITTNTMFPPQKITENDLAPIV